MPRFGYARYSTPLQSRRQSCPASSHLPSQLAFGTTGLRELGANHGGNLPGSQISAASNALGTGKVGTLAFIQYTCLFNPHLAIKTTRKGPDGPKSVKTWIRHSDKQPSYQLDAWQNSATFTKQHSPLKSFPHLAQKDCMLEKLR